MYSEKVVCFIQYLADVWGFHLNKNSHALQRFFFFFQHGYSFDSSMKKRAF